MRMSVNYLFASLAICILATTPAVAEQYMCGGDMNGDGYADGRGEVTNCIQSRYCGGTGQACANNADCSTPARCSNIGQRPTYLCSVNGWLYASQDQCQSACGGVAANCTQIQSDWYSCNNNGQDYPSPQACQNACRDKIQTCDTRWDCPFGGNYTCVDIDNPANVTIQNLDKRYLRNDGAVNADGCGGQTYVFNGWPGECQMGGYRTNYADCCQIANAAPAGCDSEANPTPQGDIWTDANRDLGACHEIGKYCKEYWRYVGCVQRRNVYCCFGDVLNLGRLLHEQGRPTLQSFGANGDWGTVLEPNCRGFTSDEYQALDTKDIDISTFVDTALLGGAGYLDRTKIKTLDDIRQELPGKIQIQKTGD